MKSTIVVILAVFLGQLSFAQVNKTPLNIENFQKKRMHFGFQLGINTFSFQLQHTHFTSDTLLSLQTKNQSGFNLGIISDFHFNENLGLRFIPSLSYGQRNLEYIFNTSFTPVVKSIESTILEFPVLFRYSSDRNDNFGMYFITGFKYAMDLASQEDVDSSVDDAGNLIVKVRKNSYFYEIGAGLDFYLQYFKFSPQIKFAGGLNDISVPDTTPFTLPIHSIKPQMILISFNFEG